MFKSILPKEVEFFDFFEQHAALGIEVCRELVALSTEGGDIKVRAERINDLEGKADQSPTSAPTPCTRPSSLLLTARKSTA
jgi:uncharacterized protein Yka (UPF0111/DUF47 family)